MYRQNTKNDKTRKVPITPRVMKLLKKRRFIVTDDGDFCSVPGIEVFTANRAVIEAAEKQGKLVKRA